MRILRASTLASLMVAAWAGPQPLYAQDTTPPAHVAAVDGNATIERDNNTEPAAAGMLLVVGDRLSTTAGRVEVLFPDGTSLAVDDYSAIDLQDETLIRVVAGRVLLQVAGAADPQRAVRYQIDTPVATAVNTTPGEFRITLLAGPEGGQTELAVLRGTSSFSTELGSMLVRAGERSLARDSSAPGLPQAFNSARFDEFDRWAQARRSARLGPTVAAQYLPPDLRMYSGTLDRNGTWQYQQSYGYVWYPTVTSNWRPYYNGHWRSYPRYGWTWVASDVWGWPTHHYGRWGYAGNRWFWAPDRRWGPSWVAWASTPGYVSWCPLGFDNRPVFALSLSIGDPWRGWAVLPRQHFGVHTGYAKYYPTSYRRLPPVNSFVAHNAAPVPLPVVPARAVPRPGSGAGTARGGVAVPRAGSSYSAQSQPSFQTQPQTGRGDASRAVPRPGTSFSTTTTNGARAVPRRPEPAPGQTPEPAFKEPLPDPVRTYRMGVREPNSSRERSPTAAPDASTSPSAAPGSVPRASAGWRSLNSRPAEPQAADAPPDASPRPAARSRSSERAEPVGAPAAAPRSGGWTAIPRAASPPPRDVAPPSAARESSPPPSAPRAGYRTAQPRAQSAPPPSAPPPQSSQGASQGRAQPRSGSGGGAAPSGSGGAPPAGARSRSR